MIKVSLIGATGYVGIELARILCVHPQIKLSKLVSQNYVGQLYSDVYPSFKGICDIECSALDIDDICDNSDIVITALPHGVSKDVIPKLVEKGVRVLDHSGDFRYKDVAVYEKAYKTVHEMKELLDDAVYGLPEIYREEIKTAKLIGNPGCYPTCSILGLMPAVKNSIVSPNNIIIDAVSGVSGAGRKALVDYSFCETDNNFKAYGVVGHRHTSEIEQEIGALANCKPNIMFTPHLAPFKRGMMTTIYADLAKDIDVSEVIDIYKKEYKDEFFVHVMDEGKVPEVKNVAGSNMCHIGLFIDKRVNKLIIISAIDNLMKGSAGQAIQALNLMCGFDEKTGLTNSAFYL